MKRSTLITAPAIAPASLDDPDGGVYTTTVGVASIVIPSSVDAASAVLNLAVSESAILRAEESELAVITAVMMTEAGVMVSAIAEA